MYVSDDRNIFQSSCEVVELKFASSDSRELLALTMLILHLRTVRYYFFPTSRCSANSVYNWHHHNRGECWVDPDRVLYHRKVWSSSFADLGSPWDAVSKHKAALKLYTNVFKGL